MAKNYVDYLRAFSKNIAALWMLFFSIAMSAQTQPNCGADYTVVNNLVVIEAENLATGIGWSKKSIDPGFTGTGYIQWENSNHFNAPGNGYTSTTINITETGTYLFEWRSKVGYGEHFGDFNDSWVRFPDADDFFGRTADGTSIVYPKGSGKTPEADGSGSDGWFKAYTGGSFGWTWNTFTSDSRNHRIYVTFDNPGIYTLEISGRSKLHQIDRMVLRKDVPGWRELTLEETNCVTDPGTNDPPIAVATATPLSGDAPLTVNFNSASSSDDVAIVARRWNFGNNTSSGSWNPVRDFTVPGIYEVSLTVWDGDGGQDTETLTITVTDGGNLPPVADGSATPTSGDAPLTVNFTAATSTDDAGTAGLTYHWDFDDGTTATGINPMHTFSAGLYEVLLTVTDAGGLSDTYPMVIRAVDTGVEAPVAMATATPLSGTAPLNVSFIGSGSTDDIGVESYDWDFGDGNISTTPDPMHTFTTAGVYNVVLTVTDIAGLEDTDTVTITVTDGNAPPVAVAMATPLNGTAPLNVNFTGSSSTDDVGVTAYSWDFNDGNTSTDPDPMHTFTTAGVYNVVLTVTDVAGLEDTDMVTITVTNPNEAPVAAATATPLNGTAPLNVNFTGSSSTDDVGVTSYSWDFNDGNTSTDPDPMHTFTTAGVYNVVLTVTDVAGLEDTDMVTITVTNPNEAPVAVATATPLNGTAPLNVNFTGSSSTDDVGVTSYSWDFNDGNTSTDPDPMHTFTTAGVYNVVLTVTDVAGLEDTDMVTITVTNPNEAPVAVATATPLNGTAPLNVNFTGSSSTDDVGVTSYSWDFDDGNTSTDPDPMHTFNAVGTYTVTLTVTDLEGLEDTDTITINVTNANQAPTAIASATPLSGNVPLDVSFTGSSSTDDVAVVSYSWDFDDGNTSNLPDPMHTFTAIGTYTVTLTVADVAGLEDSQTVVITVTEVPNQAPTAIASATPLSGNAPLDVSFAGSSSTDDVAVVSYSWDFDDGNTSTLPDPMHTFTAVGTYTVTLTVADVAGLEDSQTVTITVTEPIPGNEAPIAIASATPLNGDAPLEVSFTGSSSTDDVGIVSYSWDFNDGNTSTDPDPMHTFVAAGVYTVVFRVTDAAGLEDSQTIVITVTEPIPVNEAPVAIAAATPLSGTAPLEVSFTGSASTDDNAVVGYQWDFDNGNTSAIADPMHTFTAVGTYNVILTVTDAAGLEDSQVVVITVTETVPVNEAPIAIATATPLTGDAPLDVNFIGSTSTDDVGVVSYSWDFGDGNTATEADPMHTYTTAGEYTVTLTVTDIEGLEDSISLTITVNNVLINTQPPKIGVEVYPNPAVEFVVLELSEASAVMDEATLFDLYGHQVRSYDPNEIKQSDDTYRCNVTGLANGVYILQLRVNASLYFTYNIIVR